jgi:hypothetical protein
VRFASSVGLVVIAAACADHTPPRAQAVPAANVDAPAPVTATIVEPAAPPVIDQAMFQAEVKLLLMRRCSPCHAPLGSMHERMPFDDWKTVYDHRTGILRRIKDPDDHALLERWLGTAR